MLLWFTLLFNEVNNARAGLHFSRPFFIYKIGGRISCSAYCVQVKYLVKTFVFGFAVRVKKWLP